MVSQYAEERLAGCTKALAMVLRYFVLSLHVVEAFVITLAVAVASAVPLAVQSAFAARTGVAGIADKLVNCGVVGGLGLMPDDEGLTTSMSTSTNTQPSFT